ncbi:protein CROWDED NUCLEI 4-like [Macadamia integrifolia]|uniref:protein CROWDED NUCLEI 4-like n=1 Tax=Macadamia integrifolia TaxID=60698 RepID=UPI001C4EF551|nr:protein CROWDED NUCLEI 4-like [Macadamia integrifolia]XP_042484738.1 protein CROWDED NUCLEI 4-like [Macadamia integrifolia]
MESSQQERLAIILGGTSSKARSPPGSRVLEPSTPVARNGGTGTPLADETIWKRLREAGFDEDSIKRRDKAALIAYVAKLEAEIYDYQYQMGLLILERKEWVSKYEQVKASADAAEINHKREQAARSTALAEAMFREETLKKALGVEKECIANIEKTLHEMRAELSETKIAAESKMAQAQSMIEHAQKKDTEAETKLHAAEALQAERSRYDRAAERKLQEVEAREDELRRRLISFYSDRDAKEKEISLERKSLCESQRVLKQGQDQLLDGQALLNQREEYILGRSQELNCREKELDTLKENIENKYRAFNEGKSNLDLKMTALSKREEAVIEREALLSNKEKELLILHEKLASKEYDEIQRLIAKNEIALAKRKSDFETELEVKRKQMEDEIETKRRGYELREVDLNQKEELIQEKEDDLEVHSRALIEREQDLAERSKLLEEKEKSLNKAEKEVELEKISMEKEREEINNMRLDLQKSIDSLENKRKQVQEAQEKLEAMKSERAELLILEMKLKEEIDCIRAQKLELMTEADELKAEKAKFETEWEMIDEKREELRKEAERIAEEREAVSKLLKEERDSLKLEKDALQDQLKNDVESISSEHQTFISKMEHEHSEWFSKIQQERADFVLDIEMQKKELESRIDKRREEIENYLREREEAFEEEKARELRHLSSLKERVTKELEDIALEMKRLENDRIEINLDREQREREWADIRNAIEELQIQREKLKNQRVLLHADREAIHIQIQHLKKLEDVKIASENVASDMHLGDFKNSRRRFPAKKCLNIPTTLQITEEKSHLSKEAICDASKLGLLCKQEAYNISPPSSTPLSWLKRCTELIFKHYPEKPAVKHGEQMLASEFKDANLNLLESEYSQNTQKNLLAQLENIEDLRSTENDSTEKKLNRTHPLASVLEEDKVILEVPAVSKDGRGTHNLASACGTDVAENCVDSVSEECHPPGRKRLLNASSYDHVDTELKKMQNNKKRRQQKGASETPCVTSMRPVSLDENYCIEHSAEQEKGVCLQNQVPAFNPDGPQGGEPEKQANYHRVGNDISSCGLKTQKRIHEETLLDADEELLRQHNLSQSEVMRSSPKLNDQVKSKQENGGKIDEMTEDVAT